MTYIERQQSLLVLKYNLKMIALDICKAQKRFGDFHLKTSLGIIAADLFQIQDMVERKLASSTIGIKEINLYIHDKRILVNPGLDKTLSSFHEQLFSLLTAVKNLLHNGIGFIDLSFEDLLYIAESKLQRAVTCIDEWIKASHTPEDQLSKNLGLLRDCYVLPIEEAIGARVGKGKLRILDLATPEIRAAYLSSNAYLELTAVDIISDLILFTEEEKKLNQSEKKQLILDLSRQLLDECRHAEILASRVYKLGFELGHVPIDLHTWHLYQSFDSLPEKMMVQQVLQEGVGLDSSAINILHMQEAGDPESSELYAQITADEKNHVTLGLRWVQRLSEIPLSRLISTVSKRADQIVPRVNIPIVPEIRRLCGYPEDYIQEEIKKHGEFQLNRSFQVLLKEREICKI